MATALKTVTCTALLTIMMAVPAMGQTAAELQALRNELARLTERINELEGKLASQNETLGDRIDEVEGSRPFEGSYVKPKSEEAPEARERRQAENSRTQLKIYGQVNRAFLWGSNGDDSQAFFVDNDASSTRFGFLGEHKFANAPFTIGANIEVELESNSSSSSSGPTFGDDNGDFDLKERKLEVFAKSPVYGDFYLGQGSTASDGTAEVTFSETDVASVYSDVASTAGSLTFNNSGLRARSAFNNFDGLSRDDRFRYDTPELFNTGVRLGVSAATDGQYDGAIKWRGKFFGDLDVAAAFHVAQPSTTGIDMQYGGSASAFYKGFHATIAGGMQTADERDPSYIYGNIGYEAELLAMGSTSIAVDYYSGSDIASGFDEDTDSQSFGVGIVQRVDAAALDVFATYRFYDFDSSEDDDSINAVLTGARVKF